MLPQEYDIMYKLENTYWWFAGMRGVTDRVLGPTIEAGSKLLDVGCGTGGRLEMLSRRCRTWGIDYHERAVDFCRRRGLENIVQGDAGRLPYPDEMFSHVTCCEVLQNLNDDFAGISEAFRVLRPGGLYYVSEQAYPVLRSQHDVSQQAVRRYTRRRLKRLLMAAGFEIELMTGANTILFPGLAAFRLASRVLHPPSRVKPEEARSNLSELPGPVNSTLRKLLDFEGKMIASGRNLPFGLTIITLARKPVPEAAEVPPPGHKRQH
ncbi:MAG: class I SAM-dependent methyltransferase [Actinobacteria bacterium]|nr:class I SAM-dependent methyltransferase [Actinomycetota bacterium]